MSTTPHVIAVPEGMPILDGYAEVVIPQGKDKGRYAVQPQPNCSYCIPSDRGYMMATVGGTKAMKKQPCGCVTTRLANFLRRQRMQPSELLKKPEPVNGPAGRTHQQVQLERIGKVLEEKMRYVNERRNIIAKLEAERDEKLEEAQRQEQATFDAESELRERIDRLNIQANEVFEKIQTMNSSLSELKEGVARTEQDLASLDIKGAHQRIHILAVEYAAAIENAKDGKFRRYQADVARLEERKSKVAGERAA